MSNLHTRLQAAFITTLFTKETSRFRPVDEDETLTVDRVTIEVTKQNQINIFTVGGRVITVGQRMLQLNAIQSHLIVWDDYPELFGAYKVKNQTPWLNVESEDPSDKTVRGVMLHPGTKVIPVGVATDSFDVLCYKTLICLGPYKVEENYAEIPVSLFRNGTFEVQ